LKPTESSEKGRLFWLGAILFYISGNNLKEITVFITFPAAGQKYRITYDSSLRPRLAVLISRLKNTVA
jgi:hypothetical protein